MPCLYTVRRIANMLLAGFEGAEGGVMGHSDP